MLRGFVGYMSKVYSEVTTINEGEALNGGVLRQQRQEDQEAKLFCSYTVSLKPAGATRNPD